MELPGESQGYCPRTSPARSLRTSASRLFVAHCRFLLLPGERSALREHVWERCHVRCLGGQEAFLDLWWTRDTSARCLRMDPLASSMWFALCTSLSSMASASVGLAMAWCQFLTGIWLVAIVTAHSTELFHPFQLIASTLAV